MCWTCRSIDARELRKAMRALGFKISRESIEDMIGKHNTTLVSVWSFYGDKVLIMLHMYSQVIYSPKLTSNLTQ